MSISTLQLQAETLFVCSIGIPVGSIPVVVGTPQKTIKGAVDSLEKKMRTLYMTLTDNFQKHKWSKTRKAIDSMQVGETLLLPLTEFNNAITSASRLRIAYGNRRWVINKMKHSIKVTREE